MCWEITVSDAIYSWLDSEYMCVSFRTHVELLCVSTWRWNIVPVRRSRSPRDLNSYGYFGGRFGCTGFGIQTNIVENYVLFSAVLHVTVALERNRVDPVVVTRYVAKTGVLAATCAQPRVSILNTKCQDSWRVMRNLGLPGRSRVRTAVDGTTVFSVQIQRRRYRKQVSSHRS